MSINAPVAIGGLGGSGTRVVALMLREAGYYIGDDLNPPLDNLWFSLLFKFDDIFDLPESDFKQRLDIFFAIMSGCRHLDVEEVEFLRQLASVPRHNLSTEWLDVRLRTMLHRHRLRTVSEDWGWKAPHTHTVLDRLDAGLTGLRYIQVMRNGLDMPYARNQSQVAMWGKSILGEEYEATPRYALKFWRWAHERILDVGKGMGDRFLLVRLEDICADPAAKVEEVFAFLDKTASDDVLANLCAQIKTPGTFGRYKDHEDEFDSADVSFVERMGYDVAPSVLRI